MIGISNDRLFRRLCKALGRTDWPSEARFASNAERVNNREELEGAIADILRAKPTSYWVELLDQHDVPNDAVQNAEQVMHDPQLRALDALAEVALAGERAAIVPRLPVALSGTPASISGPPPKLGGNGDEILREAGFTEQEISELVRCGACAIPRDA